MSRLQKTSLRLTAALLALSLSLPTAAFAAPADRRMSVEKLAETATNAYRAGDYKRAIELLTRAYEQQPLSSLLYNLAKAHDKAGQTQQAVDIYNRYIKAEDADPRLRQKAIERLSSLGSPYVEPAPEPAKEPEPVKPAEPVPVRSADPTNDVALLAPQGLGDDPQAAEKQARRRDLGLGIAFETLAGGAAITAIVLGVRALDQQEQFNRATTPEAKLSFRSGAQSAALATDILLPTAAVLAGVGGWLLWRGTRPLSSPKPKAALEQVTPVLTGTGVALVAGGTF
jgi:tetratricopeptide (TPR) repeat protein